MRETLRPDGLLPCYIDSCTNIRIGLITSALCLYLALCVLLALAKEKDSQAGYPPHQKKQRVTKGFIVHHGISIYVIAGTTFIGALPFEQTLSNTQVATALFWLAGLFLWITLELLMPRNRYFDASVSYSRLVAFPASLSVIVWILTGAKWL